MSAKSLMRRLDRVVRGTGRRPVDWKGLADYRAGLRKEPPAEFARYFERTSGAGAKKPGGAGKPGGVGKPADINSANSAGGGSGDSTGGVP